MNEKFEGLVEHLLDGSIFLQEAIELLERRMIQRAMERTDGNQSEASKQLGIHRNTLQRKLVVYGLGCHRARAQRKAVSRRSQREETERFIVFRSHWGFESESCTPAESADVLISAVSVLSHINQVTNDLAKYRSLETITTWKSRP